MSNKTVVQHGDICFKQIDAIPGELKKLEVTKGFVLERGEGIHEHKLIEGEMDIWVDTKGNMFLKVVTPCVIDHEEHGKQIINPGIYEKIIEREWDYFSEEARKTMD